MNKICIVVCFIFAIIILMSIASQRYVVAPSFEQIEKWFIRNEIEWISDLLNRESERINALCNDWAFWTDTYDYISTLDDDYVITNLNEETLSLNFLNFVAIIAPDGGIIISRSCDISAEPQFIDPIFEDFEGDFISHPNPLLILDAEQSLYGIAKSKLGPAFIAAYPILKTDKSGVPAGTLVMARVFDSDFFGETFSKGGHSVRITEEHMADCGVEVYDGAYITNYSDGAYSVCKEIKTVYGDADYEFFRL